MRKIAIAAAGALAAVSPAAAAPGGVLELDQASGATITVVVNGAQLRLKVNPGANGDVTLNPDAAARARLRPSIIPVTGLIGPVKVRGRVAKAALQVGGSSVPAAFTWYDGPTVKGADGAISPGLLPYREVRIALRPSRAGSRDIAVPVVFSKDFGLAHIRSIAGTRLGVRFSLSRQQTMATAAAGALLASQYGGAWTGPPRPHEMNLGIERPVRPMRLSQSWQAGAFDVRQFLVRTADWRGAIPLPTDAAQDASEIVVTGTSRRRQKPLYEFVVGDDYLGACSSVRYAKSAGTLTFTC